MPIKLFSYYIEGGTDAWDGSKSCCPSSAPGPRSGGWGLVGGLPLTAEESLHEVRNNGEVLLQLPLPRGPLYLGAVPRGRAHIDGVADDIPRQIVQKYVVGLYGGQAERVGRHQHSYAAVVADNVGREVWLATGTNPPLPGGEVLCTPPEGLAPRDPEARVPVGSERRKRHRHGLNEYTQKFD